MQQTTATAKSLPPTNPLLANLDQKGACPGNPVTAIRTTGEERLELGIPLTKGERDELGECERIIEKGLATFYEVGNALLRIRESRLYRTTHSSFDRYCKERWTIGRSYASRVMGAAERLKLLPTDVELPRPSNEFQMRPFLRLPPEEFPSAWKLAVKTAEEGKITKNVAEAVVHERQPKNLGQVRTAHKGLRGKPKSKPMLGQLLALLHEAKRQVEKTETDKALATLERIESLMCVE